MHISLFFSIIVIDTLGLALHPIDPLVVVGPDLEAEIDEDEGGKDNSDEGIAEAEVRDIKV
ncbi:unnamed protein product [Taenia asiatica]|uniref:Secreted protein n=1 Tax=Taenia asiatica TaxID=60517 RepID=A0A0R3W598_TAEAS|nr:unnamed protein product [Taenia asiatica]